MAWACDARWKTLTLTLGPGCTVPRASSVPETSVVPSSGPRLPGGLEARGKCCVRRRTTEPWARGVQGQACRERSNRITGTTRWARS